MKRAVGLTVAAVMAMSGAAVLPIRDAGADPSDGVLSVRVIRHVNGNGSHEPALEVGVAGIPVKVIAPDGGTATGTTGADGKVSVDTDGLTGGRYRVEASVPDSMPSLKPAPAGTGLSSLTEFVDVSAGKDASLAMGVWNPADYCQANPRLLTACQRATRKQDGSSNISNSARSLVTFPFTQRGDAAPAQIANQGQLGTIYGLAFRKQDKRIFAGAFAKRLTNYGPGGPGAVYVMPAAGGPPTVFATVPNAGTATHAHQTSFDGPFYAMAGKQSLGDVEISEDGSELYVVNLNDKTLYVYDATLPAATNPKGSFAIPAGACATASDWRPGARRCRLRGWCLLGRGQQVDQQRAGVGLWGFVVSGLTSLLGGVLLALMSRRRKEF